MLSLAILSNPTLHGAAAARAEVRRIATALGYRVVATARAASADLLVVLGGDGSILRATAQYGELDKPFLGINIGSLGYLACTPLGGARAALTAFRDGTAKIEVRATLAATLRVKGAKRTVAAADCALNDIALLRGETGRLADISVSIDGAEITRFRCDGLLLATPTGSTAYSLSAGGPILAPDTPAFLLNALSPHALTARPVVLPAASTVELRVEAAETPLSYAVDGAVRAHLKPGDTIRATIGPRAIRLVQLPDHNPFYTLRDKLAWSGSAAGLEHRS